MSGHVGPRPARPSSLTLLIAYTLGLVGLAYCAATWPRAVAGVYAVSGGLVFAALLVHLVKGWLGLK